MWKAGTSLLGAGKPYNEQEKSEAVEHSHVRGIRLAWTAYKVSLVGMSGQLGPCAPIRLVLYSRLRVPHQYSSY